MCRHKLLDCEKAFHCQEVRCRSPMLLAQYELLRENDPNEESPSLKLVIYKRDSSASTLYLVCSQVLIRTPSFSRFIEACMRHKRLPVLTSYSGLPPQ